MITMPKGVKTPTEKKVEVIKSYVRTDSYNATEKDCQHYLPMPGSKFFKE